MDKKIMPLIALPYHKKGKIVRFEGGYGLQHKLSVIGIREGRIVKIVSRQPLRGPLTVEVNGCQITLGRGLAHKIMVEAI